VANTSPYSSVSAHQISSSVRGRLRTSVQSFDDFKFGFSSIRARYRDNPGRMLRCIDPFSCEALVFGSPTQYENWLIRRFDPLVVYVDSSRDRWEVLNHGQQLSISPHLHWAGWTDRGVLEMVIEPGREVSSAVVEAVTVVARAHGLTASLRLAADIRSDPDLLNLLDRMRQKLVCHIDIVRDASVRGQVLAAVSAKPNCTRGDLIAGCSDSDPGLSPDAIDAVIFWLRRIGAVHFDFVGGRYDDRTTIRAA